MTNFSNILILDDHEIVFSGIELLVTFYNKPYKLSFCSNEKMFFSDFSSSKFDLLIVDVNIPNMDSLEFCKQILKENPKQKILVYSMSSDEIYTKPFLNLGCKGFLSKSALNEELMEAVELILNDGTYVSKHYKNYLAENIFSAKKVMNPFETLTERELEIMRLFLQGMGSKEISNYTNLHSSTIGTYKLKILEKVGVKNLLDLSNLAKVYGIN